MKKLLLFTLILTLFSCTKDDEEIDYTYVSGAYKAIEDDYSYGWKGYMEVIIDKDKLALVEFDYLDEDGNKKSSTTESEYPMDPHPSYWIPHYTKSLLNSDIIEYSDIDAITGATHSGDAANKLIKTILEAAKTGDTSEQIISD